MAILFEKKILFICCIVVLQSVLGDAKPSTTQICKGSHGPKYKLETGFLTVRNKYHYNMIFYAQAEYCYRCSLLPKTIIEKQTTCKVTIDTRWPLRIQLQRFRNETICLPTSSCCEASLSETYISGGEYDMSISVNGECSKPKLKNDPTSNIYALFMAVGLLVSIPSLYIWLKHLYRTGILHRVLLRRNKTSVMEIGSLEDFTEIDKLAAPKTERLRSIDSFRGLALSLMNFIGHSGGGYWYFQESSWNGLTPPDLVLPAFAFIMGTSMMFWLSAQLNKKTSKKRLFYKICVRSFKLFLLGMIVNTGNHPNGVPLKNMRVLGILQRLGLSYFISATLHMFFARPTLANKDLYKWWAPIRDIVPYWIEWLANMVLILLWLLLTFLLPLPYNCPTGYIGPGGIAEDGLYYNCTGGAANLIDDVILGHAHLEYHGTNMELYQSPVPYDPEGILGTLTGTFCVFLGLQVGKIFIIFKTYPQRMLRFLIWALVLSIIGFAMCGTGKDNGWIPLNKNLWSLSYVMLTSGLNFFIFAFIFLLIDVFRVWEGAPLYQQGLNSLVVYVGHVLCRRRFPFYFEVDNNHYHLTLIGLWGMFMWSYISMFMDKKRVYITI